MNERYTIEITDRDGWRKTFPLAKSLVHIGSDPGNDIVLASGRGAGVAGRHLQVICLPSIRPGYRLVNLGDTDILLGGPGGRVLPPRSSVDIPGGESLRLGEFRISFGGGGGAPGAAGGEIPASGVAGGGTVSGVSGAEESSDVIGLALSLSPAQLDPERPTEGAITVRNLGDQTGVQFKLEVEGLEPDWYEVGPGPILFPNAEREVPLRLYHPRGPSPLAGDHRIRVRATAPDAHPGESTTVSQIIHILPYYSHRLRLVAANEQG